MSYSHSTAPHNAPNDSSSSAQRLAPTKQTLLEKLQRLSPQQRIAVKEILPVARAGLLYGCTCAADGLPLPCEHCLDAIDEDEAEAIELIRKKEAEGLHNWDNIRAVAEQLSWRKDYQEKSPISPILHPHLSDAWYEAKYLRFHARENICIAEDAPVTIRSVPLLESA